MNYFQLNEKFKKDLFYPNLKKKRKAQVNFLKIFSFSFFILAIFTMVFLNRKNDFLLQNAKINETFFEKKNPNLPSDPWRLPSFEKDERQRVNLLFLGIPGEPWPGAYLCDTIVLISLNPQKKKITFISIPRDLLVKIPGSNWEIKINSLLSLESGRELLKKAIFEITGISPSYFLIVDLNTFEKMIDVLGGIEIDVKEDIFDPYFPTINRGYETFSLKKGLQHLDGKIASKYIRTRYGPLGDFARIGRQQQVLQAIFKKFKEKKAFEDFAELLQIFNSLHKGEMANLKISQLKELWELSKILKEEDFQFFTPAWQGENSLLIARKIYLGKNLADVLIPKEGKFNYSLIKKEIEKLTI